MKIEPEARRVNARPNCAARSPAGEAHAALADGSRVARRAGAEPALDLARNALEGPSPALDGAEPAVDGSEPALDGREPALDGREPTLDGREPALDGSEPALDGTEHTLERGARMSAGLDATGDETDTTDLIAILLGGEMRRARSRARDLLERCDLAELSRSSVDLLMRGSALRGHAARRLVAAFALGRRAARGTRTIRSAIASPALVHELMSSELAGLAHETFHVLLLDGKHRLRRRQRISEGTLTSSLVHPREVFAPAVRERAAAVICVHNHPSGDPEPSREDLDVTQRLIEAGRLLGVPLLDHVVVGDQGYVSIRERINFDAA